MVACVAFVGIGFGSSSLLIPVSIYGYSLFGAAADLFQLPGTGSPQLRLIGTMHRNRRGSFSPALNWCSSSAGT